jgi:hypothetical protein
MSRVNDVLVGAETVSLLGLLFVWHYSRLTSLKGCPALWPFAESCYAQKLSIDQDTPDRMTSPKSEKKSVRNQGRVSHLLTLRQFPPFRQQDNTILANPPVTAHRNTAVSALQYAAF